MSQDCLAQLTCLELPRPVNSLCCTIAWAPWEAGDAKEQMKSYTTIESELLHNDGKQPQPT